MSNFLRTLYQASHVLFETLGYIGMGISTPFGSLVRDLNPALYDFLNRIFLIISDLPILGSIWDFIWNTLFGLSGPLDLTFLHAISSLCLVAVILKIVLWFVKIVNSGSSGS